MGTTDDSALTVLALPYGWAGVAPGRFGAGPMLLSSNSTRLPRRRRGMAGEKDFKKKKKKKKKCNFCVFFVFFFPSSPPGRPVPSTGKRAFSAVHRGEALDKVLELGLAIAAAARHLDYRQKPLDPNLGLDRGNGVRQVVRVEGVRGLQNPGEKNHL
jgi:hypothetical protein